MIAAGASQKLRFTIAYCSGEDYDYPARELLFHNPQTRGWQSPRTCKYPQEIILQLQQPSAIQQIQMLSHEYKIASKVEVFVGERSIRDPDFSPSSMKRLGYLSFDSNERSGHQARELKSVTVNVNALIFKFVIHRCHASKLNIYNQVGIIAVNLIGEPLQPVPPGPLGYLEVGAAAAKQPYYNKAAAAVADLNLDLHVDPQTALKIRELQRQKEAAIEAEDYDEAKRLKVSIERLKVIGQKIQQLESRKRAAVEKEDYDLAKSLKGDIDKLRLAGESAAVSMDGAAARSRNPDDIFNRVLEKDRSAGGLPPGAAPVDRSAEAPRGLAQGVPGSGYGSGLGLAQDFAAARISDTGAPSPSQPPPPYTPSMAPGGWPSPDNPTSYVAYDERPTNGRGTYDVDASPPQATGAAPGRPSRSNLEADEQTIRSHPPPGWPGDLPPPEVPAGPAAAQAGELVELAGEYAGTAFLSRNWQLREAATSYVTGLLRQGRLADRKDAYRTLVKALVRGLKDRVPNVFHSAVQLLKQLLDSFGASATQRELVAVAEQCVPVLLDKTGDANTRIKEAARGAIMDLAAVKDAGLRGMTSVFVRPVKNQNAWKPVLGTLQLLQELVPLLGISKTGEGFELGELMEYVGKALNSPNAEVRGAAVRVAAAAHELAGPPVRKLLPRDLNPKVKEQLDAAFGGEAPPAPPAARPVSATNRPPAPSKPNHANGSASRGPPPAAAPPPAPPAAGPPVDTPAAYEAEIRQREAALGPNHPEVAALCSHLAILYSQEENVRGAQSAYERALRIYEAALGPQHPDVAHTLTDLAVLHLEQGRDAEGRPLLERALVIQEKLLGPEHPDVVAIRDVLNSDE